MREVTCQILTQPRPSFEFHRDLSWSLGDTDPFSPLWPALSKAVPQPLLPREMSGLICPTSYSLPNHPPLPSAIPPPPSQQEIQVCSQWLQLKVVTFFPSVLRQSTFITLTSWFPLPSLTLRFQDDHMSRPQSLRQKPAAFSPSFCPFPNLIAPQPKHVLAAPLVFAPFPAHTRKHTFERPFPCFAIPLSETKDSPNQGNPLPWSRKSSRYLILLWTPPLKWTLLEPQMANNLAEALIS
jgi:hypothetical protein